MPEAVENGMSLAKLYEETDIDKMRSFGFDEDIFLPLFSQLPIISPLSSISSSTPEFLEFMSVI